jgi:hypothetical protein
MNPIAQPSADPPSSAQGEDPKKRSRRRRGPAPKPVAAPSRPKKTGGKPKRANKAVPRARKAAPALAAPVPRLGTKIAQILELLQRPGGATLLEITQATDWQAHSVRGFLSGALGKKRGLSVISRKSEDGARRYSIPV